MFVGLMVTIASLQLYKETSREGWRYLIWSGVVIGFWSVSSILAQNKLATSLIEIVGLILFSSLLSISGISLTSETISLEKLKSINTDLLRYGYIGIYSVVLLAGTYYTGFNLQFLTLLLLSAILIILPGLISFTELSIKSKKLSWSMISIGSATILSSALLIFYSSSICGPATREACQHYTYSFPSIISLPFVQPIFNLSLLSPIVLNIGIIFASLGILLVHKSVVLGSSETQKIEEEEEFSEEVAQVMGDIVGRSLSERLISQRLEDEGIDIEWEDNSAYLEDSDMDIPQLRTTVIDEFNSKIGPVADRKINAIDSV
jgi:hypothetical protein